MTKQELIQRAEAAEKKIARIEALLANVKGHLIMTSELREALNG